MIKKIIAIILVLAIAIPTCMFAAQESESDGRGASKEMQLLQTMGIIEKADYDKNPQDTMTRAEFAMTIVKLYGMDDVAQNMYNANLFTDVEPDYEETGYINTAADAGIIPPVSDGKFEPKSPVTAGVAANAFAYILGYGTLVKSSDDPFKTATNMLMQGGLSGLVKYEPDTVLTRGEIFDMIEDAIYVELLMADYIAQAGGGNVAVEYTKDSATTILTYYHNIYKSRGIVSANEKTSLVSASGATEIDKVKIGDYTYDDKNGIMDDYLGYNMDFYWQASDNENYDILIAWPIQTETVEINPYDITSAVNMRLTYIDKNDETQTVDLRGMNIIYNGVATAQNINFKPESGSVTLIDNNGDGNWDIIKIISYTELIYRTSSADGKVLYGRYEKKLDLKGVDEIIVIDADTGTTTNLGVIEEGTIVSGFKSPDGRSATIYYTKAVIEGALSLKGGKDPDDVKIGDTYYKLSQTLAAHIAGGKLDDLSFGGVFKYYLNFEGNIANYERVSDVFTDYEMAYLMAAAKDGSLSETVKVKLYSHYNMEMSCTLSKKVIIDGSRVSNSDKALEKLCKLGESGTQGLVVVPQLIRVKMDENKVITHIDMAASAPNGEDNLYIMYDAFTQGEKKYYTGARGFVDANYSPALPMTPDIPVFAVEATNSAAVNGTTKISYTTVPSAFVSGSGYSDFIMYGVNESELNAKIVVRYAAAAFKIESADPYCLFLDSQSVLADDGTVKQQIVYTKDGQTADTLTIAETVDISKVKYDVYTLDANGDEIADSADVDQNGIKYVTHKEEYALAKGDVFRYKANLDGEVVYIEPVYSCAQERLLTLGVTKKFQGGVDYMKAVYPASPTAASVHKLAGILRLDENFMEYSYDDPSNPNDLSSPTITAKAYLPTIFEKQGAAIVYNKTHDDFRKISKEELLDYETVKDECSKGVFVVRSLTSRYLFLYED